MKFSSDQYLAYRNLEIEKEKIELIRDKKDVQVILGIGGAAQNVHPYYPMGK